VLFIYGPRLARAGRTNRGGRNQVVGGQSGWVSVEEGGIRDACQVAVGLLCVEWFAHFALSVCRREPKRTHTIFKTRRKFEIKCLFSSQRAPD
jgi:hypothetical protein